MPPQNYCFSLKSSAKHLLPLTKWLHSPYKLYIVSQNMCFLSHGLLFPQQALHSLAIHLCNTSETIEFPQQTYRSLCIICANQYRIVITTGQNKAKLSSTIFDFSAKMCCCLLFVARPRKRKTSLLHCQFVFSAECVEFKSPATLNQNQESTWMKLMIASAVWPLWQHHHSCI